MSVHGIRVKSINVNSWLGRSYEIFLIKHNKTETNLFCVVNYLLAVILLIHSVLAHHFPNIKSVSRRKTVENMTHFKWKLINDRVLSGWKVTLILCAMSNNNFFSKHITERNKVLSITYHTSWLYIRIDPVMQWSATFLSVMSYAK